MKKFKKLIPAMVMLLIATMLMGTTTYAWFSMNTQVTVTGMQVRAVVGDSLAIASSSAGTTKAAESAFGSSLDQSVMAVLQPSSTIDGTNFFYTNDAKVDGSKQNSTTGAGAVAFTSVVSNTIGAYKAYADYVFEVKAVNADSSADKYITIDKVNLLYNNAAITAEKAYRVAIFVQALASESAYNAIGTEADAIYTLSGAHTFKYATESKEQAISSTTEWDDVTYNEVINTMTVTHGETAYYKLTVRLWLEGEDTTCNNTTFLSLTKEWELDLSLSLTDDNSTAVNSISTVVPSAGTATLSQTLNDSTSSTSEASVLKDRDVTIVYTPNSGKKITGVTVTIGSTSYTTGVVIATGGTSATVNIPKAMITGAIAITVTTADE